MTYRGSVSLATMVCLCAAALIALPADDIHAQASVPRNLSRIVVSPAGPTPRDAGVSQCAGLQAYREKLGDLALTETELARGAGCIAADFDSNGYLDFAIWGGLKPSKRGFGGTRTFAVLFFRAGEVLRTETISREDYDQALLWIRGSGHDGACSVARQPRDGIKLPGEGRGTWFYAYDASSKRLRGDLVCDE